MVTREELEAIRTVASTLPTTAEKSPWLNEFEQRVVNAETALTEARAEVERLREALTKIAEGGYRGASFIAQKALALSPPDEPEARVVIELTRPDAEFVMTVLRAIQTIPVTRAAAERNDAIRETIDRALGDNHG
jgi:hypothetical protein